MRDIMNKIKNILINSGITSEEGMAVLVSKTKKALKIVIFGTGTMIAVLMVIGFIVGDKKTDSRPQISNKIDKTKGVDFIINIGSGKLSEEEVKRAIGIFKDTCKQISSNWADIVEAKAEVEPTIAPHRIKKGWNIEVVISVKLPNELKYLPEVTKKSGVTVGHTLWYRLGGGKEPGIFATKRVSQEFCGMEPNQDGIDVFTPVPELAFITIKQDLSAIETQISESTNIVYTIKNNKGVRYVEGNTGKGGVYLWGDKDNYSKVAVDIDTRKENIYVNTNFMITVVKSLITEGDELNKAILFIRDKVETLKNKEEAQADFAGKSIKISRLSDVMIRMEIDIPAASK